MIPLYPQPVPNEFFMKNNITKATLFNYFAGGASALQKQLIDDWAKDENNREFFFECLSQWEIQNLQYEVNVQDALERHQQRIHHQPVNNSARLPEPVSGNLVERRIIPSWFGGIMAASVGIVLLLGGFFFKDDVLFTTYHTAFGETRSVLLTDGSLVTLNANSSLQIPRFGFGQKTREVRLNGEADFFITHTPDDRHFVVRTDKHFDVVVLGTEFLVNTRDKESKVVLNKGKVQLLYQEGNAEKQLTMKPGNLVTFDQKGHLSLKQTLRPQDHTAWKEHRFVFAETTLSDISRLFAENYGITLQITDKALSQWTISGSFTAYSAEELIETLTSASNLRYQKQGNTIVISEEP